MLARLQQIGRANAGLEISRLEVDSSNLSFAPADGDADTDAEPPPAAT